MHRVFTFFFGIRRWDAHIIDEQNNKVLVHYVGGTADEDEWIPSTSERLRYADTMRITDDEEEGAGDGGTAAQLRLYEGPIKTL